MNLPDDENWHWHECERCEAISGGFLLRRNAADNGAERPVIVLFQTGTPGVYNPLLADLNRLPFEADDATSDCGGALPTPWAWEDLSPEFFSAVRNKGRIFFRQP